MFFFHNQLCSWWDYSIAIECLLHFVASITLFHFPHCFTRPLACSLYSYCTTFPSGSRRIILEVRDGMLLGGVGFHQHLLAPLCCSALGVSFLARQTWHETLSEIVNIQYFVRAGCTFCVLLQHFWQSWHGHSQHDISLWKWYKTTSQGILTSYWFHGIWNLSWTFS